VFTYLHATTIRDGVGFDLLETAFDADGLPCGTEVLSGAAESMLDQLVWWGLALRDARAARPYVS
jgi:hypothetical protein